MKNVEVIIPSNEIDRKAIIDCVKEVSDAMTRIEAEKDFIKDAIDELSEKFELPKALLNKISRIYHKNSIDQVASEHTTIEEVYSQLFPPKQ